MFVKFFSQTRISATVTKMRSAAILKNPNFPLNSEWANRLQELKQHKIGHDSYEWITLVQKKYSGGGKASAIDLDVACTLAEYDDQVKELLDLYYKLRHTEHTADTLPSTDYGLCRLFLANMRYEDFFKLLNDPFNYGLFPNEHCCCLYLNHFLDSGNLHEATRLAIYVMHQELFSFPLLNYLCTRSLLQFLESGTNEGGNLAELDERVFPRRAATLEEELSFNEENVKIYRFPWLKVPHNDGHFDLSGTNELAGKSLEWLSWHLKLAEEGHNWGGELLPTTIRFLAFILQKKMAETEQIMVKLRKTTVFRPEHSNFLLRAFQIGRPYLAKIAQQEDAQGGKNDSKMELNNDLSEKSTKLLEILDEFASKLAKDVNEESTQTMVLWRPLAEAFEPIQAEEEHRIMEEQRRRFVEWGRRRIELIESQTQRVELSVRLEEMRQRRKELTEERELLYFFENRPYWEDKTLQRSLLEEHLGMLKKKGHLSEDEYSKTLFEMGQMLKEGKTASEAIEKLQPGLGPNVHVMLKSKSIKK